MTHWQHRENFTYACLCEQHVDPDWQWVIACWSQIIGSCHEIEKLEQHHAWPSRSVDLPGTVSPAAPGGYSIRFTRQLKNMCHLSLNIRITVVTEVSFLASCRDLGTAWMQLAWHACTTPSGNKDWDGYSRNDACNGLLAWHDDMFSHQVLVRTKWFYHKTASVYIEESETNKWVRWSAMLVTQRSCCNFLDLDLWQGSNHQSKFSPKQKHENYTSRIASFSTMAVFFFMK